MGSGDPFIYSIIGLGFGIFLFFKGFSWFRLKRLIENLPTSKIRSLAMGLAEIYGEVVPADKKLLKSPFTGHDCVYYRYTVEEYQRSGKNSKWVTIKSGKDMVPFFIKDNTGSVLVDPADAQIDIPYDYKIHSDSRRPPSAHIKAFLQSNGKSHKTIFGFQKKMRYTEYFMAPKDNLYILGSAGKNPFVKDGTAKKNEEGIMMQKGDEKIYYISDKPEDKILQSLKLKIAGGFFGGGALIVVCLTIILLYLKMF